jgi:hypothetical protein
MNAQTINLASILKGLKLGPQQGSAPEAHNRATSKKVFSRLMNQGMRSVKEALFAADDRTTQRAIADGDWLEKFRNHLLSAGISLKDLSLSPKSLPALKNLLLAQGLSEDDVQPLLESLFGGDGRQEIEITQLLTKLSELKVLTDRKACAPVLEVSVLPYLETLLRSLGLDVVQARKAMTLARVDGGRLRLKGLAQALKGIMGNMPEETKAASINQGSGEDVQGLLARIGVVDEATKMNGPMSLERFVQLLEDKVANLASQSASKGEIENHMNRLLGHVLAEPKSQGRRSGSKAFGGAKQHLFPVEGLRDESVSQNFAKGIEDMVARGAWKTSRLQGESPSLVKGLQDMVSSARPQADASTHADNKSAELFLKAKEQMILVKRGPLDQRVDQDTKNTLYSAREAVMDQPQTAGTAARQMARPFPLHVINQVGRQMAFAIRRGENQVRLQLKPPDLGSIQLNMVMKDHVLKVAMITEHLAVKELLMSHVQELREALVEQGVELQRIDINIDHHFGQSLANAQKDLNDTHSWRLSLTSASGVLEAGPDHSEEVIEPNVSSDALVDMFA